LEASTLEGDKGKAVVGRNFTVTATRFVLAASCVENARLLLYKTDLKKTHWALGNYLMTHPLIRQAATFTTSNDLKDPVGKVDFNCEQWPNQTNRIELSLPSEPTDPVFHDPVAKVTIELKDEDYRTIFTGLDAVGAALEAKGHAVKKSFSRFKDKGDIIVTGEHAMGATRMGTSTNNAVVDSDCKVFQISNLYVAGGSVFPTGGWANPTLTIIALAVRLARHLAKLK
jgi:hypothetical protein